MKLRFFFKKIKIMTQVFPPNSKFLDAVLPFVIGGCSGITATSVIQPVDMLKVRIQIKSEQIAKTRASSSEVSPFVVAREIYAFGGVRAFYKGYFVL